MDGDGEAGVSSFETLGGSRGFVIGVLLELVLSFRSEEASDEIEGVEDKLSIICSNALSAY